MKIKNVIYVCIAYLSGYVGLFQTAQAAPSFDVDMQIENRLSDTVHLTGTSWPLSPLKPQDLSVVAGTSKTLGISYDDETKGAATFSYSAGGGRSCLFTAGHDVRESFGWFKPTKTPYQWIKATSQGSFAVICTAEILSYVPGKSYKVKFKIK